MLLDKIDNPQNKIESVFELEDFLKKLNDSELLEFIEAVFVNNDFILSKVFPVERNMDKDEYALLIINKLPYYILKNMSFMFETIAINALENLYDSNDNLIINKLITFSSKDIGIPNSCIWTMIGHKNIKTETKLRLLFLLKERNEINMINKYLGKYNVYKEPYIFPFIIHAVDRSRNNILEQFKMFVKAKPEEPNKDIMAWFTESLFQLLEYFWKRKDTSLLFDIYNICLMNKWLEKLFVDMLSYKEFHELKNIIILKSDPDSKSELLAKLQPVNVIAIIQNINSNFSTNNYIVLEEYEYLSQLFEKNKQFLQYVDPAVRDFYSNLKQAERGDNIDYKNIDDLIINKLEQARK